MAAGFPPDASGASDEAAKLVVEGASVVDDGGVQWAPKLMGRCLSTQSDI